MRRRRVAVLGTIIALVAITGAVAVWKPTDADERLPEVTFSGALQAIEEGKVERVHMNDGTGEAVLVLRTGLKVVTVYPERSGPELVETARTSDVRLTASRRIDGKRPWIRYAYLPAGLAGGLLCLWITVVMDRRGILHDKDTWMAGSRVKRLEASVDRLNAEVERIGRRLEDDATDNRYP